MRFPTKIAACLLSAVLLSGCMEDNQPTMSPEGSRRVAAAIDETFDLFEQVCVTPAKAGDITDAARIASELGFRKSNSDAFLYNGRSYDIYRRSTSDAILILNFERKRGLACGVNLEHGVPGKLSPELAQQVTEREFPITGQKPNQFVFGLPRIGSEKHQFTINHAGSAKRHDLGIALIY